MFGYVNIDKPNIMVKDFTIYRAFYCGLCVAIGRNYGNVKRLLTNYDVTFLTIFTHAILSKEIEINNTGCILSPKKKTIVKRNDLMDRMANISILLASYKLDDDIVDTKKLSKKSAKAILNRAIKKAKAREPQIATVISKRLIELSALEKENCPSIEKVAEPFAYMIQDITKILLGDKCNNYCESLMFSLGKWIYLMDAIDDIESDKKANCYNPFIAAGYSIVDKEQFLRDNNSTLSFLLHATENIIKNNYEGINITKYEGVITNILWYGLPSRSTMLLNNEKLNINSRQIKLTI